METASEADGRRTWVYVLLLVFVIGFFSILFFARLNAATAASGERPVFRIEKGDSVSAIAENLYKEELIRSPRFFKLVVRLLGTDGAIIPGEYRFPDTVGSIGIAQRIGAGEFGIPLVKITIPEGSSNEEIAKILRKKIPNFKVDAFLAIAQPLEGYLFPDTYFFSEVASPEDVIEQLHANFKLQFAAFKPGLEVSGRSMSEIVTMASLIEKEVNTPETRDVVAGILWKRLDANMPLQVDASFTYLLHKTSREITRADLELDSPYNTYRYKGLPPGPIANPGREAMRAVLYPRASPYLFYLSARDGSIHYAKDFEAHKRNKEKFLN